MKNLKLIFILILINSITINLSAELKPRINTITSGGGLSSGHVYENYSVIGGSLSGKSVNDDYQNMFAFFSDDDIGVPWVETLGITDITSHSAISGGNVIDIGGSEVTARGVCWNTTGNPTTDDNLTSDGQGLGEFSSSLTNLEPFTVYYIRAYATNSEGTAYGEEKIFKTIHFYTSYEYWFDNKTDFKASVTPDMNTVPPEEIIDGILEVLSIRSFSPGLHFIYLQLKDGEENVGEIYSRYFIVPWDEPWQNENNRIVAYEYWIDNNYGERVIGEVNNNSFTIETEIDYSSLNRGLHYFHIHFKDSEGKWSAVQSTYFIIPCSNPWSNDNNVLTDYEYWIDNKYNERVAGSTNNSSSFNITDELDYSGLNRGLHFFHIHFKDNEGKWSAVQSTYFIIPDLPPWENPDNKITGYKYWFDNDYANSINIELDEPVSLFTLEPAINIPHLANGPHKIFMQYKDIEGKLSAAYGTEFEFFNSKPVVSIDLSEMLTYVNQQVTLTGSATDANNDPITDYEWSVVSAPSGSELIGVIGSTTELSFTPDVGGNFRLSFRAFDGYDWSEPADAMVHVISNRPPVAICSDVRAKNGTDYCDVETSIDFGSYDPDGDEITITQVPPGPYPVGTTEVTLTVTDSHGESSSCTGTVTVVDLVKPVVKTKDPTVTLIDGNASITVDDVNNGSYDNCGIASMTLNRTSFDCSDISENGIEVTLTVTDIYGNTETGTSTLLVQGEAASVNITVDPEYTVTGEEPHTIYLGYSTQSVTLTANTSGGNEFEYQWTSNLSGYIGNTQSITVTPTQTTTYTVSVTNEYGCTDEATVTIAVYDWRCGNNLRKIKVCHNGKTICIDDNAVDEHLGHGDYLGDCRQSREFEAEETIAGESFSDELAVRLKQNSPNPFSELTEIQYFVNKNEKVTLNLVDVKGRIVANLIDKYVPGGWNSLIVNGSGLTNGVYFLHLESNGKTAMMAITKY